MKAAASISFRRCSFMALYEADAAAYDSDPSTLWVMPFAIAQEEYWGRQTVDYLPAALVMAGATLSGSRIVNSAAEGIVDARKTAVFNSAQSAYETCLGGGSAPAAPAVEPRVRISINTKLEHASSASATAVSDNGVATQLTIRFAPITTASAPLDWRPFWRLGSVSGQTNDPSNWLLTLLGSDPYSAPVPMGQTPLRVGAKVTPGWLAQLTGEFVQCIDYPPGREVATPSDPERIASFSVSGQLLDFLATRWVSMPGGELYTETVDYSTSAGVSSGFDLIFPAHTYDSGVPGQVVVRHAVVGFSAAVDFALQSDIQKLRIDSGALHDFPVLVTADGFLSQMAGQFPDAYVYVDEIFDYMPDLLAHLEIDYVWGAMTSLFYRVVFKLHNTLSATMGVVLHFANNYVAWVPLPANTTKYYASIVPVSIGTFSTQFTKPINPDTNPAGQLENKVSKNAEIKVFSESMQYDYPGTSGFMPLTKSVYVPSSENVPAVIPLDDNCPDYSSVSESPIRLIPTQNPLVIIANWEVYKDDIFYPPGWYPASGGLALNKTAFYDALSLPTMVEIAVADLKVTSSGSVWATRFYDNGSELNQARIHNAILAAIASDPNIRNVVILEEPPGYFSFLTSDRLRASDLVEVSTLTLSPPGASERFKYALN